MPARILQQSLRQCSLCHYVLFIAVVSGTTGLSVFGDDVTKPIPGFPAVAFETDSDRSLNAYFEQETRRIEIRNSLRQTDDKSWNKNKKLYRKQLAEMLGLSPFPKRTPLKVTVTGEIQEEQFLVRKLHYQSSPGLYVTANLYLPKKIKQAVPAILYVCGHARVVKEGVSYGNKIGYHHHGVWFARNGFACLIIDTIQLGELQGIHHGTYSKGMWWWNARGYTPAGVEAWNGIRGIDYLQSLPEVDGDRIGITGRSGGGAYSWWIAALDERIRVAVPVAGITSMRNHIVDGCIEGHCDCMFMVNSYGWDFPKVAALVAPRPLLITNTDNDRIFPLDGVMDVYWQTRHIYEELDAGDKIGLAIAQGPHKDTQRLRVNAFEWFNRFLKDEHKENLEPAEKVFQPQDLQVFKELPKSERTTTIHNSFVPEATNPLPESLAQWKTQQHQWKSDLQKHCFSQWPESKEGSSSLHVTKLGTETKGSLKTTVYSFIPQDPFVLPMYLVEPIMNPSEKKGKNAVTLYILGPEDWPEFVAGNLHKKIVSQIGTTCFVPTRGVGPAAWTGNQKKQTQIRRRFALLGQTLDGMRVWDVRKALHAIHEIPGFQNRVTSLRASGPAAEIAMFASLFETDIAGLTLQRLPDSLASGAIFLNVLKFMDTPQALALAAEKCPIQLIDTVKDIDSFANRVSRLPGTESKRIRRD